MHQYKIIMVGFILLVGIPPVCMATSKQIFPAENRQRTDTIKKKGSREEKWNVFWKAFTASILAKDKKQVARLTSGNFYDGGGGTVEEWLDADAFFSDKRFATFKAILKKPVKSYSDEMGYYKATGKNSSGDLFFLYEKGNWLFGGVVGD